MYYLKPTLKPVFVAALLVARVQRPTLRLAQQENNKMREDRALSCLTAMGVGALSTSRRSARTNESALMETGLQRQGFHV